MSPLIAEERWPLALSRSLWQLSIVDERDQNAGWLHSSHERPGLKCQSLEPRSTALALIDQNALLTPLLYHALAQPAPRIAGMQPLRCPHPQSALEAIEATMGLCLTLAGIRAMGLEAPTKSLEPEQSRAWRDSNPRPSEPESDALSN